MPRSKLIENGKLVDQMRHAVLEGEKNIKHIPGFIELVIDTGAWEKRWVVSRPIEHKCFLDFVSAQPLAGMGWMPNEKTQRYSQIESLLRFAPDVLKKWRRATTAPKHVHRDGDNITIKPERGTSLAYTLDRLEREKPELYVEVVAGKLSANAAAIKAGWRKKLTPYEQILRLLPKLTPEEQEELLNHLYRLRGCP